MKKTRIVLASRNQNKVREINAMISEYLDNIQILSLDDVGLLDDVEETGKTFEENALLKARYAVKSGYIAFADDSGLVVPALGGEPGIYSARYAGDHGDDKANRALLLEKLAEKSDRAAHFLCCIACVLPNGNSFVEYGSVEGKILYAERGEGGFGYDNLFWYDPAGMSFAEMSPVEKNAVSHRRRAVEAFAKKLAGYLANSEKQEDVQ